MNFEDWLVVVAYKQGVCVEELDPMDWAQAYEDDCTPEEAAEQLIGDQA